MAKLKPKNEDEFGIITDEDHQFDSVDKAINYVKDLREKVTRRAGLEEFPITTAFPEERRKFIDYGISLMTKKNLPFVNQDRIIRAKSVLHLISRGYTHAAVAHWLRKNTACNVTPEQVKEVEKEAMMMAKEAIARVQNTKIPVVGG